MPYSSTGELPSSVRSKYSGKCQRAFMHAFNSVHERTGDEGRAMAAGHSAAQKCEGKKDMDFEDGLPEARFKIYTGLLKAYEEGDDESPMLTGIASSTTRDHHGDVMLETALRDMEAAANSNMTIFLNHSYNVPEDVAGSVRKAVVTQRGFDADGNPNWDLDIDIAINRANERAVKSWAAIKNGTKLGLSIGAAVPKGGAIRDKDTGALTVSRILLLETSIVSIPANPRSWISSAVKALNKAERVEPDHIGEALLTTTSTNGNASITWTLDTTDETTTAEEVEEVGTLETVEDSPEVTKPRCPDCGGHRNSPKGDCDNGFHKTAEITAPQEAPPSGPENEGGEPELTESIPDLDPIVRRSVEGVLALLETTTAKLVTAREQAESDRQARVQAEAQRDEAVRTANEMFAQARTIFERLAATPLGRKTSFRAQHEDFKDLEGIYGEEFRQLLNGD